MEKEAEAKLRAENNTQKIVALMILGAAIQVVLVGVIVWQIGVVSSSPQFQSIQNGTITISNTFLLQDQRFIVVPPGVTVTPPPTSYLYWSVYFIFTICYCVGASFFFKPKKLISPLYIQIISVGIIAIILVVPFFMFYNTGLVNLSAAENVAETITILGVLMLFSGVIQTFIVKYIIGVNGTTDDLDRTAYTIHAPFEVALKTLRRREILNLQNFRIRRNTSSLLIIKTGQSMSEQVIFALTPDKDNKSSVLASAAYDATFTSIRRSSNASIMRDSVSLTIDRLLEEQGTKMTKRELNPSDLAVGHVTIQALRTTHSQFGEIIEIPPFYKKMLVTTIAAIGVVTVAWIAKFLDQSQFIELLAVLGVAVLFQLIPLMRESLKESKSRELVEPES